MAKTLLPWLHFKTDHALHREDNKAEFLKGQFLDEKLPFLHKKKTEHSFELSLSIWWCIFNLEMQNFGVNTTSWWLCCSHIVENEYPSLRFPNMIKVNFHEHWTWVTRFNPLWVSRITNIIISILKSLVIPAFCLALSSVVYSLLDTLFFALNHICSKLPHSCSKLLHFCFKLQHFCSISSHFYVKNKMSFKSLFVFHFSTNRNFP